MKTVATLYQHKNLVCCRNKELRTSLLIWIHLGRGIILKLLLHKVWLALVALSSFSHRQKADQRSSEAGSLQGLIYSCQCTTLILFINQVGFMWTIYNWLAKIKHLWFFRSTLSLSESYSCLIKWFIFITPLHNSKRCLAKTELVRCYYQRKPLLQQWKHGIAHRLLWNPAV